MRSKYALQLISNLKIIAMIFILMNYDSVDELGNDFFSLLTV